MIGVATAALIVAGIVAVVVEDGGGEGSARSTTTSPVAPAEPPTPGEAPGSTAAAPATTAAPGTTTATTAAPAAAGIESAIPVLKAFVERERGLSFKQPVKVTLLANAAFEARLRQTEKEEDLEDLRDTGTVLQAVGLLDAGVDLVAEVQRYSAGAVLGFYDTETKELVVRGAEPTPFVRSILVHELLHALEDQHFDLDRPELGDEALIGFQALAEGSASRIEDRYVASLSSAERRSAGREAAALGSSIPRDVPRVVPVAIGFPYAYGPGVVRALLDAGGQRRLDAAFPRPPASSEQVLDPGRYLGGDNPRQVAVPKADAAAFDDGEIGQFFLQLMLDVELDRAYAQRAADGWGGDRYVAWKEGGRTCVRAEFVMDNADEASDLADALARWASERSGAASATGTTLRTCG